MADDINRQHIYNIMDWLEEEQEKKNEPSESTCSTESTFTASNSHEVCQ